VDREGKATVLLTTHYMLKPTAVDRVAIINAGRAGVRHAVGAEAAAAAGADARETTPLGDEDVAALGSLGGVRKATHRARDGASAVELILEQERVLGPVIGLLESRRIGLLNLTKREPTLEDVFVDLVGRSMDEVEHA
jgi:ABC-2 type transport system ATP-binding protein